jgi:hypothetical protein
MRPMKLCLIICAAALAVFAFRSLQTDAAKPASLAPFSSPSPSSSPSLTNSPSSTSPASIEQFEYEFEWLNGRVQANPYGRAN